MRKVFLVAAVAVFLVFALSGVALAQTPQDIYDDWALDGKLDGTYTDAQLQAFLADALIHQYGDPASLTALDTLVRGILNEGERSWFPFTGAQIALMALVTIGLLGGGIGLTRLARSRA